MVGIARVHEALGDLPKATAQYKRVLQVDPSHVEALSCLAANHFYTDQPELALRFYRRLLQMGLNTPELWCNLGLCCFYASQYDMALSCLEKALGMAGDAAMADVWYNIAQVAIGIGDLGLAYQGFKIAISVDSNHAEAYANLGVLELRKGNIDAARSNFSTAQELARHVRALLQRRAPRLQARRLPGGVHPRLTRRSRRSPTTTTRRSCSSCSSSISRCSSIREFLGSSVLRRRPHPPPSCCCAIVISPNRSLDLLLVLEVLLGARVSSVAPTWGPYLAPCSERGLTHSLPRSTSPLNMRSMSFSASPRASPVTAGRPRSRAPSSPSGPASAESGVEKSAAANDERPRDERRAQL